MQVEEVLLNEHGLKKKVLQAGNGEGPQKGQEVEVLYRGTLMDGSEFDSNQDRESPFKFTLGNGSVIKGWDEGVAAMKKGEKCLLTCPPDYAYGKRGSPPKIPADSTLQFEVELLDFHDKKKEKWELSDEEKLNESITLKNKAAESFRAGAFADAAKVYAEAQSYLEDVHSEEAESAKKVLWLNLSTSYLKAKQYQNAVKFADKALGKQPQNVKALYRKGSALCQLDQFEASRQVLQKALRADPSSPQIKKELDIVQAKRKRYQAKQRKVMGKMFSEGYMDQEQLKKDACPKTGKSQGSCPFTSGKADKAKSETEGSCAQGGCGDKAKCEMEGGCPQGGCEEKTAECKTGCC